MVLFIWTTLCYITRSCVNSIITAGPHQSHGSSCLAPCHTPKGCWWLLTDGGAQGTHAAQPFQNAHAASVSPGLAWDYTKSSILPASNRKHFFSGLKFFVDSTTSISFLYRLRGGEYKSKKQFRPCCSEKDDQEYATKLNLKAVGKPSIWRAGVSVVCMCVFTWFSSGLFSPACLYQVTAACLDRGRHSRYVLFPSATIISLCSASTCSPAEWRRGRDEMSWDFRFCFVRELFLWISYLLTSIHFLHFCLIKNYQQLSFLSSPITTLWMFVDNKLLGSPVAYDNSSRPTINWMTVSLHRQYTVMYSSNTRQ